MLPELFRKPIQNFLVNIFPAKATVSVNRLHLDNIVSHFKNRNVKRAASKIKYSNFLVLFFIETVCERRRRRLVNDSLDIEPRNFSRVFGCLPLGIVKIRRHRYDGFSYLLARLRLRIALQLLKNHCRDFLRTIFFLSNFDFNAAVFPAYNLIGYDRFVFLHTRFIKGMPDKSLDAEYGVLGIGDRLPFCEKPDEPLARLGNGDDGGSRSRAFRVFNDAPLSGFYNSHCRVRGTEVYAEYF